MFMVRSIFWQFLMAAAVMITSCSTGKSVSKSAKPITKSGIIHLEDDSVFLNSHIGISVFDPITREFIYRHQDDKYFVPASNTKIFSCYAGMKLLGKNLPGMFYVDMDTAIVLVPTGDPTFLHKDYPDQPVADFIRMLDKKTYMDPAPWNDNALGRGWSWDDYSAYYMAERSPFPIYGNVVRWYQVKSKKENPTTPADTVDTFIYSDPELDGPVDFGKPGFGFRVERKPAANAFTIYEGRERNADTDVPFITNGIKTAVALVQDSLHKVIIPIEADSKVQYKGVPEVIYSRPVDSMLKPMMHRSDNFFAEQTLLMAGQALNGKLSTPSAVESITSNLLGGIPDKPAWADGSGLSRFNLFTPRDFIWVLDKMKNEFSWERITHIFATGGEGTLRTYVADSGRLYAKTGTLTGVMALSGFVVTKRNKVLVFSILVNNHKQPTVNIRNRMSDFLHSIIDNY
jgi:D-alanyl-D-alanine carboxypeptidase/D-alanyl-D-alanine-endopeptidase (penicillin-binding protein 4)